LFTAVFLIVALWPLVSGHSARLWALAVSGLLLLITVATPALLTVPNRLWMKFGLLLHGSSAPLCSRSCFYVVVTPMGWIMRGIRQGSVRGEA
jgi:hypothetical protein